VIGNSVSGWRSWRGRSHGTGYRRLRLLLERRGQGVNHKRLFRVYQEAGLRVRRREPEAPGARARGVPVLSRPNQSGRLIS
jgi:hypothetical protein